MKKSLSTLIILTLMISLFPAASARQVADGQSYVAYLSGNFTQNLGKTEGNIYTAYGDVSLALANSIDFKGNIYYQKDNSFTKSRSFYGSPKPLNTTSFTAEPIEIPDAPSISNYVDSFTANGETISESTHYGNLVIDENLNIDTSSGDVIIVADNFSFSGNITIIGQGKFLLFVNSPVSFTGTCSINNGGNSNQVHIFVPSFSFSGAGSIYGNIYQRSDSDITVTDGALLRGNLVTSSNNITISNAGKIYGVVYAPNADIEITSQSSCMYGRVVAKSINLNSAAELRFKCDYSLLCLPYVFDKYDLNVLVSPEGAGTVTTNGEEFSYGEIAEVRVTPNDGYEFVGYDTNSVLPDADGKITMKNTVYLIANFKAIDDPIELKYSYAYLYGYGDDSGRVGPEDPITREQASALIFRILKQNGITDFEGPATPTFNDINTYRWSYLALEYMTSINVFNSSSERIFPEQEITRGEAAKIISMALNIAPNESNPNSLSQFTDIDETHPYYYYIKALYDSGNMQGVGTEMMPNSTLTRAMVVTIINRLIGRDDRYDISSITESPYTDISPTDWFYEDIVRASFGFTEEPDPSDNLYKIDPAKKVPREEIDY